MAVPLSIRKSIQAVRMFIASGGGGPTGDASPYSLCLRLFQNPGQILKDADTLDAVLALAPEIKAYRGKGSQIIQKHFDKSLAGLLYRAKREVPGTLPSADLFSSEGKQESLNGPPPFWAERLSDYFFERVREKKFRSQHAADLRSGAWLALGELSHLCRRRGHLPLALETVAEKGNREEEREGAIQFLVDYWAKEDPDEATIQLLENLSENSPSRSFLVSVLDAQIQLGLNDEMGALFGIDDWDDAEDEGEEE